MGGGRTQISSGVGGGVEGVVNKCSSGVGEFWEVNPPCPPIPASLRPIKLRASHGTYQ